MNEIITQVILTVVYFSGCPNGAATAETVVDYAQDLNSDRVVVNVIVQPAPGSDGAYLFNGHEVSADQLPDFVLDAPSPSVFVDGNNVLGKTDTEGATCAVKIPTRKQIDRKVQAALE